MSEKPTGHVVTFPPMPVEYPIDKREAIAKGIAKAMKVEPSWEERAKTAEAKLAEVGKAGAQLSDDFFRERTARVAAEERAAELEGLLRRAGILLSRVPIGQVRGTFAILGEIANAIGDFDPEAPVPSPSGEPK